MTNEKKAREIAEKNAIIYDAEEDTANGLIYPTIHSTKECEKSALEMAEWKDQQFKEFLEKEREELLEQIKKLQSRNVGYDNFEECYTYMAAKLLRIIEKLFKED